MLEPSWKDIHVTGFGYKRVMRHRLTRPITINEGNTTRSCGSSFIFFILGPCEPLIPLMSLGSGNTEILSSLLVVLAFCGTTILTMLFCVMFFYYGISRFSLLMKFENYMHAATGLIIFLCGSAIQFLGA